MDLSIVLPTLNEKKNAAVLLRTIPRIIKRLGISYEVIVVDGGSKDGTVEAVSQLAVPVEVIVQKKGGYGEAMRLGFARAKGDYIMTLDADLSHNPALLPSLWQARNHAELVIASRYVPGGSAEMPFIRRFLSRILSFFLSFFLSLPIRDFSSGFRLYKTSILKTIPLTSENFEIHVEILIKTLAGGWKVTEIPMGYRPRRTGKSKARLMEFGLAFGRTALKMWRLRNSIQCADYDERAYDSRIPFQRTWQRRRHAIISGWAAGKGRTLDVGCGSSRILKDMDLFSVGLDNSISKLRYARKFEKNLVNGSAFALPFRDASFDCVICSALVQHLPAGEVPFLEMRRVLAPGGWLILATPDYGRLTWRILEILYRIIVPGGYARDHRTQYSRRSITEIFSRLGFKVEKTEMIFNSEMVFLCTLPKNKP